MESEIWEPGIILNETSSFNQGDKQQLLWGYPGILWAELAAEQTAKSIMNNIFGIIEISAGRQN